MASRNDHRLREHRRECGLTQAELATRAGVSRQLVAAVEAGRNAPAVDAALSLAHALGTTVEVLFAERAVEVVAALGGRLRRGASLRVGRVADRLVAAELPDHGALGAIWATPDAVYEAGGARFFAGARLAGTVIAGCDPAIGVAETMLDGLGPRSLLAISAPTGTALHALRRGTVHAAIVHGPRGDLPEPPIPVVRWHLARWWVGLAFAPRFQGHSFDALLRSDATLAQREPGAASQQAFERARVAAGLGAVRPGPRATGHLDAARLAAVLDGAAVTTASAASSFGLGFLALEEHVVEVWAAKRWAEHPGIEAFTGLLATPAFMERISHVGGYDLRDCGARITAAGYER